MTGPPSCWEKLPSATARSEVGSAHQPAKSRLRMGPQESLSKLVDVSFNKELRGTPWVGKGGAGCFNIITIVTHGYES